MRINNNVTAMNTHRMYTNNNNAVSSSVGKLSSGYRINSAADDAAGLAISEKMRAQIRGLTQASANSQDAVSLVQTAEGALQETHNILQRMRELAVQAASDTNETSIDRAALDAEFQALKAEIDEISTTTRFNDQNLLDGTFSSYKSTAALSGTDISKISYTLMGNGKVGSYGIECFSRIEGYEAGSAATFSLDTSASEYVTDATFTAGALAKENSTAFNKDFTLDFGTSFQDASGGTYVTFTLTSSDGVSYTGTAALSDMSGGSFTIDFGEVGTLELSCDSSVDLTGLTSSSDIEKACEGFSGVVLSGSGGANEVEGEEKFYIKLGEEEVAIDVGTKELEFRGAGITLVLEEGITADDLDGTSWAQFIDGELDITQYQGKSLVIQTGANEGDTLAINLDKINTNYLGIYTCDISTRESASSSITYVNAAINLVSTQRGELGALANRLEHKIANLDTSAENLTAAESRIRDVDMAAEMTNFTKNNILSQAATAMLAQANALPQNVLQLLG